MITERLAKYIEYKQISYYKFQKDIGAGNATIAKALKNHTSIASQTLERIALVYQDLNPVWLLTGEGEMIITETPKQVLPSYNKYVKVQGDNMSPVLKSGDIALYKTIKDSEIIFGELYYVVFEHYATIAYIRQGKKEDIVILTSENKKYQNKEVNIKQIRTLGHIRASIRINTVI